jgi:hypothetical protein
MVLAVGVERGDDARIDQIGQAVDDGRKSLDVEAVELVARAVEQHGLLHPARVPEDDEHDCRDHVQHLPRRTASASASQSASARVFGSAHQ